MLIEEFVLFLRKNLKVGSGDRWGCRKAKREVIFLTQHKSECGGEHKTIIYDEEISRRKKNTLYREWITNSNLMSTNISFLQKDIVAQSSIRRLPTDNLMQIQLGNANTYARIYISTYIQTTVPFFPELLNIHCF